MYEDSNFSTASPILAIGCLFDYSHSSKHEVASYCGFDFFFLMTNNVESFNLFFGHLPIFLDISIQICCLFF